MGHGALPAGLFSGQSRQQVTIGVFRIGPRVRSPFGPRIRAASSAHSAVLSASASLQSVLRSVPQRSQAAA